MHTSCPISSQIGITNPIENIYEYVFFYQNITEIWNRNYKFLFFIYLGSGTSKSCSKTFCYAFWLHREAEYEGPAYVKWFNKKGLLYPVDDNGEFLQQDQVQELLRNKAETRKNCVKCKVTDIVCQWGNNFSDDIEDVLNYHKNSEKKNKVKTDGKKSEKMKNKVKTKGLATLLGFLLQSVVCIATNQWQLW